MPPVCCTPLQFHAGSSSTSLGASVGVSRRSVQLVTPWRAALAPVMRLHRDGELMLDA